MKTARRKRAAALAAVALLVLVFSATAEGKGFWRAAARLLGAENREAVADNWDLSLHFIDVGKADALLVENRGRFFLVDGGDVNSAGTLVSYLQRRGVTRLEGVFMTHPDADHIGALPEVLESFETAAFYTAGATAKTPDFWAVEQRLKDFSVPCETLRAGDTVTFENMKLQVLSPENLPESSNDSSLVLRLTYGDFSALLTGDAGKAVETKLLSGGADLKSDVLKISHHGSKTASTQDFLRAVSPLAAVISSGEDRNRLPDPEVTGRLAELEIPAYRTDTQGTVIVLTDGRGAVKISTKERDYEITDC